MTFPERFSNLPEYAFPRLRTLLAGHEPGGDLIDMTIGAYEQKGVRVFPCAGNIRAAMVAEMDELQRGQALLRDCLYDI